jgi:hypothetical protein
VSGFGFGILCLAMSTDLFSLRRCLHWREALLLRRKMRQFEEATWQLFRALCMAAAVGLPAITSSMFSMCLALLLFLCSWRWVAMVSVHRRLSSAPTIVPLNCNCRLTSISQSAVLGSLRTTQYRTKLTRGAVSYVSTAATNLH